MRKYNHYCRWCGDTYKPKEDTERDGFCSARCKQAHYRAYKKYVTHQAPLRAARATRRVTQKKRKKRK